MMDHSNLLPFPYASPKFELLLNDHVFFKDSLFFLSLQLSIIFMRPKMKTAPEEKWKDYYNCRKQ